MQRFYKLNAQKISTDDGEVKKLNDKELGSVVSTTNQLQDTVDDYGTDGLLADGYRQLIERALAGDKDCEEACLDTIATECDGLFITLREWLKTKKPPLISAPSPRGFSLKLFTCPF